MHISGSESEFVIAGSFDENNLSSITRQQFDSCVIKRCGIHWRGCEYSCEIGKSTCVVLPSTYGEVCQNIDRSCLFGASNNYNRFSRLQRCGVRWGNWSAMRAKQYQSVNQAMVR